MEHRLRRGAVPGAQVLKMKTATESDREYNLRRAAETPPRSAVSVSKADEPEPCVTCPEGTAPHAANYVLRWRDGSLRCERRACKRVLPDMIEDVLLGNELE